MAAIMCVHADLWLPAQSPQATLAGILAYPSHRLTKRLEIRDKIREPSPETQVSGSVEGPTTPQEHGSAFTEVTGDASLRLR